jgi:hypothetical protein
MSLPEDHIKETEKLLRAVDANAVANWFLNTGYYPEQYVMPPCFSITKWKLRKTSNVKAKDLKKSHRFDLKTISFPKTGLYQRVFAIIHPKYYHDIVFVLRQHWDCVLDHLFNPENKIFCYSIPIPVTNENEGAIGPLRGGRMIYEFLTMAENDLVAEAYRYSLLVRIDISNFYNSVYTHTIGWALHGRNNALDDGARCALFGSELDRLFQYSNDARTNGIPVGPAISDFIAELILINRDVEISKKLKSLDYLATRFKDDYRFLCKTEQDADKIIRTVISVLNEFNLIVNETKTKKLPLPEGLYRPHSIKYSSHSLGKQKRIPYRKFEACLLKALEIHREHQGTSLLEKFLSELIDNDKAKKPGDRLKIIFVSKETASDQKEKVKKRNVKKFVSLLLFIKNGSPKCLAKVLAIYECLLERKYKWFGGHLKKIVISEIKNAIKKESGFELMWLLYFIKRHDISVDLDKCFPKGSKKEILENPFIATLTGEMDDPFEGNNHVSMFQKPDHCKDIYLVDYLDIFYKGEPEH